MAWWRFVVVCIALGAGWAGAFGAPAADAGAPIPIPIIDFVRANEQDLPRLSPDGRHLAVRVLQQVHGNDVRLMAVYDLASMKIVSLMRLPIYNVPLDFHWVSNTRVIVVVGLESGTLESPEYTGEVLATDVDGSHQDYLYGYQRLSRSRRGMPDDHAWGYVESLPTPRNGHFFLREVGWQDNAARSVLYDINAETGVRKQLADLPFDDLQFVIDHHGRARYATGRDSEGKRLVLRHAADSDAWVRAEQDFADGVTPYQYAADDQALYAMKSRNGGPRALVVVTDGQGREDAPRLLASDAAGNINLLQAGPAGDPFAAASDVDIPHVQYVGSGAAVDLHRALSAQFPGEYVDFESFSADGGRLVFRVVSDTDPGTYYLYDSSTRKAEHLFDRSPHIDPARMAARKPIAFKASDGLSLHGYLTLPRGQDPHDLPMVLLPHGGPHGVADDWFYDNEAQFLASRGYAVLQVNYRGSGGRGVRFLSDGHLQWGERIQADLADGVRWAIDQHIADRERIGVVGGSFGGYSALMQPIRNPGLYRCAVGYAGVYDLPLMYDEGDIAERGSGKRYLVEAIGQDAKALNANSPDKLADQVKIPVLLVHGEADVRAPFTHAERMRAALQHAGNPAEWLAVAHEGHGFYSEKNRVAYYEKLEQFLAAHLHP